VEKETDLALDTSNRCDACGAQAYVEVGLPTAYNLFFCAHHWDRNKHILDVPENIVDTKHLDAMRKQVQAEATV
jgi:hypothetical protein